jgi:hypothetical protein
MPTGPRVGAAGRARTAQAEYDQASRVVVVPADPGKVGALVAFCAEAAEASRAWQPAAAGARIPAGRGLVGTGPAGDEDAGAVRGTDAVGEVPGDRAVVTVCVFGCGRAACGAVGTGLDGAGVAVDHAVPGPVSVFSWYWERHGGGWAVAGGTATASRPGVHRCPATEAEGAAPRPGPDAAPGAGAPSADPGGAARRPGRAPTASPSTDGWVGPAEAAGFRTGGERFPAVRVVPVRVGFAGCLAVVLVVLAGGWEFRRWRRGRRDRPEHAPAPQASAVAGRPPAEGGRGDDPGGLRRLDAALRALTAPHLGEAPQDAPVPEVVLRAVQSSKGAQAVGHPPRQRGVVGVGDRDQGGGVKIP